jgi:hypothetical protein
MEHWRCLSADDDYDKTIKRRKNTGGVYPAASMRRGYA